MADFQTSTHRSKWIFSPQKLVEKYTDANQRAKQTLEQCGATLMEVDADGSLSYPESQTTANNSGELALAALRTSNALHKVLDFDRGKKREKKSKHKSRKSSNEAQNA
ncbi:hypothetical protein TSUD_34560 [Trifolium subterraneum]|uniref:Uncharacterized protein n=1 Tax=Trifolium subterraneum TaxID=3900 RepID=A0A2Z6P2W6_TRISU|nr:hypothetical protein TSUD_34560 [Trifolium subterraneum]